ncbi:MAG: hypothetical protein VYB54_07505 [Pseudomonadota bacterium]|nr:hypothetical protein [Pseudomonadota bacterium]
MAAILYVLSTLCVVFGGIAFAIPLVFYASPAVREISLQAWGDPAMSGHIVTGALILIGAWPWALAFVTIGFIGYGVAGLTSKAASQRLPLADPGDRELPLRQDPHL